MTSFATQNDVRCREASAAWQMRTSDRFVLPQNDRGSTPSHVPSSQFPVPNPWLLTPNSFLLARSVPCR